jgi:hypothetical protein
METTDLLDWRLVRVFDDRLEIAQDLPIVQQRAVLRVKAIEPICGGISTSYRKLSL